MQIQFELNGQSTELTADKGRSLLWVLRDDLGLTGTKFGCGAGLCGACTILVNDEPLRSCQFPVSYIQGKKVVTIEGLARNGALHPLQKAFVQHDAMQCGFCTPGMIVNAYGVLKQHPRPTRLQIDEGMHDNLCRCGAHVRIIDAIQTASDEMAGEDQS